MRCGKERQLLVGGRSDTTTYYKMATTLDIKSI
jgi:hypothetical protein